MRFKKLRKISATEIDLNKIVDDDKNDSYGNGNDDVRLPNGFITN